MTGRDFLNSKWMRLASRPGAARGMGAKLAKWTKNVRNTQLLKRAGELWDYFNSARATPAQKAIMLGALIYLVSPLDVVPDWIPLAGLLDDLGVATFVLNYIFGQLDADKPIEGTDGENPAP